jgi:hypothetical protein
MEIKVSIAFHGRKTVAAVVFERQFALKEIFLNEQRIRH